MTNQAQATDLTQAQKDALFGVRCSAQSAFELDHALDCLQEVAGGARVDEWVASIVADIQTDAEFFNGRDADAIRAIALQSIRDEIAAAS